MSLRRGVYVWRETGRRIWRAALKCFVLGLGLQSATKRLISARPRLFVASWAWARLSKPSRELPMVQGTGVCGQTFLAVPAEKAQSSTALW